MDESLSLDTKDEEAIVEEIGSQAVENWSSIGSTSLLSDNNSPLLYIAVEYVCNNDIEDNNPSNDQITQENCTDFITPRVSPLDPNMCSVAQYSPVSIQYQENVNASIRPIIIQRYVAQENTDNSAFTQQVIADNSLGSLSPVLPTILNTDDLETNKQPYLEVLENNEGIVCASGDRDLISDDNQQGVKLLINNHDAGKSYDNNRQFLGDRPLGNNDFLNIMVPNPKINPETYTVNHTLENVVVYNSISNNEIDVQTTSNKAAKNYFENVTSEMPDYSIESQMITRSNFPLESEEERLLSYVYVINDKPVPTRARASLPDSHLKLGKVGEEDAVFAKRIIPKSSQFGPLKGVREKYCKEECNSKEFLINLDGIVFKLVMSDENYSNWMGFVRRSLHFDEQNLIVSQEGNDLYFTATRNIQLKEELKVGYSSTYASQFNLEVLKPIESLSWPCYECPERFATSDDLLRHFNVHDKENNEDARPKRKYRKSKLRSNSSKSQVEIIECNICQNILGEGANYAALRQHLVKYHQSQVTNIKEQFNVLKGFQCNICGLQFLMEILLNIHKLEHNPELPLDQSNHVCPQCQRKFPTRKQLVLHVASHALPKVIALAKSFKCPVCHRLFAHSIRLQKHIMSCHGSDESKPLQCKFCKKRLLTKSALIFHMKSHKKPGEKHFQCVICRERFDHVLKLKLHIPEHAHNNTYSCPSCSKVFSKYSFLRKHTMYHNEKTQQCPHCPKVFATGDILKKHMLRHSDHKEFLCADCGKQFKRKDKLSDHIKIIHMRQPNRPNVQSRVDSHRFTYRCHSCLMGFKRRGMLLNHFNKRHPEIRVESVPELNLPVLKTTKSYPCEYCDKVYKTGTKRKYHVLKAHPGSPLPVDKGKKISPPVDVTMISQAATNSNLIAQPNKCLWCHRQYLHKSKLLHHMRKFHPSELMEHDLEPKENIERNDPNRSATAIGIQDKLPEVEKAPKELQAYLTAHNIYSDDLQKNKLVSADGNINQITPMMIDVEGEYQVLPIVYE